jgi:hypothetical protein
MSTGNYEEAQIAGSEFLFSMVAIKLSLPPQTPKSPAATSSSQGPTTSLFHKGELNQGKVSGNRSLSTGTNRQTVNALDRNGPVHEFKVPTKKLKEWESGGKVQRFKDFDSKTGVINEEIRILPPESGELNNFKVTE